MCPVTLADTWNAQTKLQLVYQFQSVSLVNSPPGQAPEMPCGVCFSATPWPPLLDRKSAGGLTSQPHASTFDWYPMLSEQHRSSAFARLEVSSGGQLPPPIQLAFPSDSSG